MPKTPVHRICFSRIRTPPISRYRVTKNCPFGFFSTLLRDFYYRFPSLSCQLMFPCHGSLLLSESPSSSSRLFIAPRARSARPARATHSSHVFALHPPFKFPFSSLTLPRHQADDDDLGKQTSEPFLTNSERLRLVTRARAGRC